MITLARPPTRSTLKITNRSFQYAAPCLWNELPTDLREPRLDLRVAAVKSTESTWPLQVKSSHFSCKSPPKFSTQVAAKF